MTETIWKYVLPVDDLVELKMPRGARILHIAVDDGPLLLWARVDPDEPIVRRLFAIVGTGNPCAVGDAVYVGSVQQRIESRGLTFVWHVFDQGEDLETPATTREGG